MLLTPDLVPTVVATGASCRVNEHAPHASASATACGCVITTRLLTLDCRDTCAARLALSNKTTVFSRFPIRMRTDSAKTRSTATASASRHKRYRGRPRPPAILSEPTYSTITWIFTDGRPG